MKLIGEVLTAAIFSLRNFFGLIFYPYRTVRQIANEEDRWQVVIVFLLVYGYFNFANIIRRQTLHPLIISSSSLVLLLLLLL